MKRTAVVGLVLLSLTAGAASSAAAPKAKPKPKPVTVVHHLHGTQQIGEIGNQVDGIPKMDTTAPTGSSAKSMGITNYAGGPNTECAGNSLFPVWIGDVAGAPVGDATVDLVLQGVVGSGNVEVRLFADVFEQACNEAYVTPIGSATAALATGQTSLKVVLKGINRKAKPVTALMLQVSPVLGDAFQGRVSFDAASADSKLTFLCLPNAGKKAC